MLGISFCWQDEDQQAGGNTYRVSALLHTQADLLVELGQVVIRSVVGFDLPRHLWKGEGLFKCQLPCRRNAAKKMEINLKMNPKLN